MNLGLLVLRLIVGGIFAVHGYAKLFGGPEKPIAPEAERYLGPGFVQQMQGGPKGFAEGLGKMGVPMPETTATAVGAVEFFGGLFLMLGFFTRLVALLLGTEMVVAIWKAHWSSGLVGARGYEFPLSLLGACLAFFIGGSGIKEKESVPD